jgi:predicted RNA polymerase sigma factor
VLTVVYLIFNEGYGGRGDLAAGADPARTGPRGADTRRAGGQAGQVEAALALAESLDLEHYHYLHATRAELLRRLGRTDSARAAYHRALELVHSDAERRFLERRLAEL